MTKQEEIREGIGKIIGETIVLHSIRQGQGVFSYIGEKPLQDLILEYLRSQGVVIKVEDWLPMRDGMTCTVEPLIKGY
uniref:Uncharacterized protein n=1 Tax=viral metagenome TaxID=1070528 RepID=A0A6M3K9Y3_9ZZZZ